MKLKHLNRKFIERDGELLILKRETRSGYQYSYIACRVDNGKEWHSMPYNVVKDHLFKCWATKLALLFYFQSETNDEGMSQQ